MNVLVDIDKKEYDLFIGENYFSHNITYIKECLAHSTPLKEGHWINHKDEHQCSNCSEVVTGDWGEDYMYDYCPNCGAKMVDKRKVRKYEKR